MKRRILPLPHLRSSLLRPYRAFQTHWQRRPNRLRITTPQFGLRISSIWAILYFGWCWLLAALYAADSTVSGWWSVAFLIAGLVCLGPPLATLWTGITYTEYWHKQAYSGLDRELAIRLQLAEAQAEVRALHNVLKQKGFTVRVLPPTPH